MEKKEVAGRFVKRLTHTSLSRGMRLLPEESRCILRGEIHEIVTTDHKDLRPGDIVKRVGFLGFAEFTEAGVIDRSDNVLLEDRFVGIVIGFDDCHYPNHYNILIQVEKLLTGEDVSVQMGSTIRFGDQWG